ncbi:phenoloxidase-activating factor 2-like [Procambarus clarkii]|uniref:phenoloxidase-activating factor 2-like n=1 Tax=Procambarus clarkii TaxID=6728 RepID=UPI001E672FCD|nr:phenoloxidase-activating factor 2-like [Procambarus clarkii]
MKVALVLCLVGVCCCQRPPLPPPSLPPPPSLLPPPSLPPPPQRVAPPCPQDLQCVPPVVCSVVGLRAREPFTCGTGGYEGFVCCLQRDIRHGAEHRSDHRFKLPHPYMDFYDDEYDRLYSGRLSKQAKEVLRNYRYKDECGVRNRSPEHLTRVSSGYLDDTVITSFGEFPWHVALLIIERNFNIGFKISQETLRYHCGATLINPLMLLTAAHCVKGIRPERLKASLGDWNLYSTTGELFPAVERRISRVFIHTGYNPTTYLNDIALLQMERPVDILRTPHISPACLPDDTFTFDNHLNCFIVGWGDDVYKPNFGSNVLKATLVTYTADEECKRRLYKTLHKVDDKFVLDIDNQKCIIGGYGRDACVGDGGGAVVCPLNNKAGPSACRDKNCAHEHYFISGIISFGSPVCGEGSITVIADITNHIDWIYTIIRPAGGSRGFAPDKHRGRAADGSAQLDKNAANSTAST